MFKSIYTFPIAIVITLFMGSNILAQGNGIKPIERSDTIYWAIALKGQYKVSHIDFGNKFGNPIVIGLDLAHIRSKSIFGLGASYWFGTSPKNDSILQNISIDNRYFLNNEGVLIPFKTNLQGIDVRFSYEYCFIGGFEGGWYAGVAGGPYWYKTLILLNEESPVMNRELRKGYDDLTIGGIIDLGLSYKFISNTLGANYSFGVSYQLGYARNVRSYSYYNESKVQSSSLDGFFNFNFTYYFPLSPNPIYDEYEDDLDLDW